MTYKTHINFGILFAILTVDYIYRDSSLIFVFIVISAISSLIPDIDHKKSISYRKTYPILCIILFSFLLIRYRVYILAITISWLILACLTKHRTFTHSLLGMFLFCIPFYNTELFIPMLIGYASHLFADIITVDGISLFYPIIKRRISIGGFVVGSIFERALLVCLMIINIILVIRNSLPINI